MSQTRSEIERELSEAQAEMADLQRVLAESSDDDEILRITALLAQVSATILALVERLVALTQSSINDGLVGH